MAGAASKSGTSIKSLIDRSFEAMSRAYCPYSKFTVGAAVLCEDGTVFTGCNVENASYSVTICAERVALTKAVSEGHTNFTAIAVAGLIPDNYIAPCGNCRQFMAEFGLDYDVYMCKADKSYIKKTVRELLPMAFTPKDLEDSSNKS